MGAGETALWVHKVFNWDTAAEQLSDLYRALVFGEPKPSFETTVDLTGPAERPIELPAAELPTAEPDRPRSRPPINLRGVDLSRFSRERR